MNLSAVRTTIVFALASALIGCASPPAKESDVFENVTQLTSGYQAQVGQLAPDAGLQEHDTCLASLAEHRDLPSVSTLYQVAPGQAADLADAQATQVEQAQQDVVAGILLKSQHPVHGGFIHYPLTERRLDRRQLHRRADIERDVADAMREGEQRLHG